MTAAAEERVLLPSSSSVEDTVGPGRDGGLSDRLRDRAQSVRLSAAERTRYSRQLLLPGFDLDAQRRLKAARVLVLGAGGLGSPALLYLASAGIGALGIVDDDAVDASNLQRQIVHTTAEVGSPKVDSAARAVGALNPEVDVIRHRVRLTADNALDLFSGYDLVVDGADNFQTRYLAGDAAEIVGIPQVWGSLLRFEGQVSVFWAGHGPTYRDVFPEPPDPGEVPSCAEGGVFGPLCGEVGSLMAGEAIKLLTGAGDTLLGRIVVVDAQHGVRRELTVTADPDREPVTRLTDYEALCGLPGAEPGAADPVGGESSGVISPLALHRLLAARAVGTADFDLIDVREPAERDIVSIAGSRLIPKDEFLAGDAAARLDPGRSVVVYCKSGVRSARVRDELLASGFADVRSLDGGVLAWVDLVDPSLPKY